MEDKKIIQEIVSFANCLATGQISNKSCSFLSGVPKNSFEGYYWENYDESFVYMWSSNMELEIAIGSYEDTRINAIKMFQYVFDKSFEIFYNELTNGECDENADVEEALNMKYSLCIPYDMSAKVNTIVPCIVMIAEEIYQFMKEKGYQNLPTTEWLHYYFCAAASLAKEFILEQDFDMEDIARIVRNNRIQQLEKAQNMIHEWIQNEADEKGLTSEDICPIFDGVADIEAYIDSPLKIMWLLKEPYDDFDDQGNPIGGGWVMYKDGFNHPDAWKQKSYQGMIYIIYGYRHNTYWGELPAIRNNKSMLNELKSVAYMNMSKMPGQRETSNQAAASYYSLWKEVLETQLRAYNPDVIIFGGSMKFFEPDFDKSLLKKEVRIGTDSTFCDVYKYDSRWLISAKHPSRFSEVYVDGVIDSLKFVEEQKNKS